MAIPPLALPRERLAICKMVIEFIQIGHDGIYYPSDGSKKEVDANLVLTLLMVIYGHANGTPMTQAEIARQLRQPRPTVIRRLKKLEQRGMIARENNKSRHNSAQYYFTEPYEGMPMLQRSIKTLSDAFDALAGLIERSK